MDKTAYRVAANASPNVALIAVERAPEKASRLIDAKFGPGLTTTAVYKPSTVRMVVISAPIL
jgi:hypothetical protein